MLNQDDEENGDDANTGAAALMKPLILAHDINRVHPSSLPDDFGPDDDEGCPWNPFFIPELSLNISAPWVKAVESGIESVVWRLYNDQKKQAESHVMFVADPSAAGLKADKVVLVGAPEGTDLMYAGPITTDPNINSIKVAEIGGIQFYMNPTSASGASSDVLVPAWLAKPSPKQDAQTLKSWAASVTIYIQASGEVTTWKPSILHETARELSCLRFSAGQFLHEAANAHDEVLNHLTAAQAEIEELKGKVGTQQVENVIGNETTKKTNDADVMKTTGLQNEVNNGKDDKEGTLGKDQKDADQTLLDSQPCQDLDIKNVNSGDVQLQHQEVQHGQDVQQTAAANDGVSVSEKTTEGPEGQQSAVDPTTVKQQVSQDQTTIEETKPDGSTDSTDLNAVGEVQETWNTNNPFKKELPNNLRDALHGWTDSKEKIPAPVGRPPLFIKAQLELRMLLDPHWVVLVALYLNKIRGYFQISSCFFVFLRLLKLIELKRKKSY